MSNPLSIVRDLMASGRLQQDYIGKVNSWPLLHFTPHAGAVLQEGFLFGESNPFGLDMTNDGQGQPKRHAGPGYNFAFNAISWDEENQMHDFQVATPESERSLLGMYADSAILFLGTGLHTRHFDEFKQVIFWGESVDLRRALHLQRSGDGVSANAVDCWRILDANGLQVSQEGAHYSLRDCVVVALHHWMVKGMLTAEAKREFLELYEPEISELQLPALSRDEFNPKPTEESLSL